MNSPLYLLLLAAVAFVVGGLLGVKLRPFLKTSGEAAFCVGVAFAVVSFAVTSIFESIAALGITIPIAALAGGIGGFLASRRG
jgi:hypothetical protein